MIKREMPKRVTLPTGRTFVARYERVMRDHLRPFKTSLQTKTSTSQ